MTDGARDPRAGDAWAGLLRRERLIIAAGLAGVTLICWLYLYALTLAMPQMGGDAMTTMAPMAKPWSMLDALLMLVMWWVMMIGMMLPSAAPMILTFATINRKKRARGRPYVATAVFAAGYLLGWGGFSLAATALQWAFERLALLSPMMVSTSVWLGGGLFVAAGLYQLTPLKHACLKHCRSPFDFILNRWRDGAGGALRMGLDHGLYCLGCCWVVMALLFVGGVMNLLWVAAIAIFVLAEKLLPAGEWIARLSGLAMTGFGVYLLIAG